MDLQTLKEKQIALIKKTGTILPQNVLSAVRHARWFDELNIVLLHDGPEWYDVVLIWDYLDHVPEPRIAYFVARCERVAKERIIVHSQTRQVIDYLNVLGFTTNDSDWLAERQIE